MKKEKFYIYIKIFLTWGFSTILVICLLRFIDLKQVGSILIQTSKTDFFTAISLFAATILLSVLKWRLFVKNVPLLKILNWAIISQFFFTVLPGLIGGDLIKIYGLRKNGVPSSLSTACAIIDRFTKLTAMMFITAITILFSAYNDLIPVFLKFTPLIIIAVSSLFYWLSINITVNRKYFRSFEKLFFTKKILKFVIGTMFALKRANRDLTKVSFSLVISFLNQILYIGIVAAIARSNIAEIHFIDWCWITGIVTLVFLFPFSAGGLGLREGGYAAVLSLLNVPVEKAIALSLALYSIQVLSALLGAIFYLHEIHRHSSLSKIR